MLGQQLLDKLLLNTWRGFEQIKLSSVIIHHFGVDEVLFLGARNVPLQKNPDVILQFDSDSEQNRNSESDNIQLPPV